jgi:hypothetical protein
MRLLAFFSFAFLTGTDGYLLVAPYAIFCMIVMYLVHKSRQARTQRVLQPIAIPANAGLVPNL